MKRDAYPQFPLYVPTKGRADSRLTNKALTEMGVRHYLVVEPQEVEMYREAARGTLGEVLELDLSYKQRYELLDDLGMTKSTGPGPARNFIWDHSIKSGFSWHWVMDDNIKDFYRQKDGIRRKTTSPAIWRAMEDFCLRYKNIGMAGPNYTMFSFVGPSIRHRLQLYILNTRIYSCNLIRNDIPFRWRGRYNEDTILSIDMMKAGWCTVQFNAFMQGKVRTQILKGGNTQEFYDKEGTIWKSRMQCDAHPDVSRLVWKFGRWHHYVNYKAFKNKLILRDDISIAEGTNEYGMALIDAIES